MKLEETIRLEHEKTADADKAFRHDLTVVLAAACLLIILLYSGTGVYSLLYYTRDAITDLIADWKNVSAERADELFKAFYNSEILDNALSLISYLLSLFVPVFFAKKFLKNKPKSIYPLNTAMPEKAGSFIFFSVGLCYSVNIICNYIFSGFYPVENSTSGQGGLLTLIMTFVTSVILAPLLEELVFRGVFFQSLSRYSQPFAVFLSALIFGLAHRNPPSVINAFVMGICLAICFAKTHSITLCVLIHLINNAFVMLVTYMAQNEKTIDYTAILGLVLIAAIIFTAVMLISYVITKKANFLVYNDEVNDYPRLGRYRIKRDLLKNFFFWFYLALIGGGITLLYI